MALSGKWLSLGLPFFVTVPGTQLVLSNFICWRTRAWSLFYDSCVCMSTCFYRSFNRVQELGGNAVLFLPFCFFFSFSWKTHIHPFFSNPPSDRVQLVHCCYKVRAQCLELRNMLMSSWLADWISGWMDEWCFLSTNRWSSEGACLHLLFILWASVTLTLAESFCLGYHFCLFGGAPFGLGPRLGLIMGVSVSV